MAYNYTAESITTTPADLWTKAEGPAPQVIEFRNASGGQTVFLEMHGVLPDPVGDPVPVYADGAWFEFFPVPRGLNAPLTKIVAYTASGTGTLDMRTKSV